MKLLDYIRGARKGKEAHRIEYDAMSDPFLADAIEGFDSVKGDHADRIAQLQARVTNRVAKHKKRSGAWRIAVAAIAFIAVISGYFTLMNHESSMVVASCDNCYIEIYAPEDYIERRRLELTLEQEQNPNKDVSATAIVDIENLDEIIKPIERIIVYLPGNYAQMKSDDADELRVMESRRKQAEESIQSESDLALIESDVQLATVAEPTQNEVLAESPSVTESLLGKVTGVSVYGVDNPLIAEKKTAKSEYFVDKNDVSDLSVINKAEISKNGTLTGTPTSIESNRLYQSSSQINKLPNNLAGTSALNNRFRDSSLAKVSETPQNPVQNRISGQIIDQSGEPLIGAIVTIKGSNKATVTDLDGKYSLETDSQTAQLIASYIGYESVEIPDPSTTKIVAMKPSEALLDEIVVTGYGTVKKKSLTGSTSSVQAGKIQHSESVPVIGRKAYRKYLKEKAVKPTNGECAKVKGKVVLEFTIDASGRPQNITVVNTLCAELDKIAIELIQAGSNWTQGTEKVKLDIQFK